MGVRKSLSLVKDIWAAARARMLLRKADFRGRRARAWGRIRAKIEGELIVHDRVRLDGTITPIELAVMEGATLEIGENTYINYGASIAAAKRVTIGKDCLIGTYVNITDNNFHQVDPDHRYELPESLPVVLEDRVWLGTRVIVLPGVRIGECSVIGAGSVVTHDIPARVIAAGAPAKVVRAI